jgi:uncharacterized protein YndB with AHSA1/START domain
MSQPADKPSRELVLTRDVDVPREKLWRGWTEVNLLKQWFVPKPWFIASAELDVRPGGANRIVMCSPEGQEFPNLGVYLEVVPNERLVITDAYTRAWEPAEQPSMTAKNTKPWVSSPDGASASTSLSN